MKNEYPPTAEGVCRMYQDFLDQIGNETNILVLGMEAWLVRNGAVAFEGEPQRLGEMEPNLCFKNAHDLALADDDLTYFEGFVMLDEFPLLIAHAWCVDLDDQVIDPTLPADEHKSHSYFGVAIPTKDVCLVTMNQGTYGILDKPEGRALIERINV